MEAPTSENRLADAPSPYLQQHADNPVNWQPWDEQALAAARENDAPIFLSIGYSACHWCHVMEEESFQDEEIAKQLNDHFVPIKVDREERPDLDRIYQTVCQLVTRRGGWPLSVWLTPDGKPFYVGTYFPPEAKRGMPAFPEILSDIATSWDDPDQRSDMLERAEQWTAAVSNELESVPDPAGIPTDTLESATTAALRAYDTEYGGFGSAGPKFPQPARVSILLRADAVLQQEAARTAAKSTLNAMADGGIYDHIGGGFHRYATDRKWTVPHFEKMLYDQGELVRLYCHGYQATGERRYGKVIRETLEFLNQELSHSEGGFYSTLDARSKPPDSRQPGNDSGHEEGAYYTWTPAEVRDAIKREGNEGLPLSATDESSEVEETPLFIDDEKLASVAIEHWGVTDGGNFEGTTVLTIAEPIPSLADSHDLSQDQIEQVIESVRHRLRMARESRPRPNRDEKVLAGWNGLALSAFATGAVTLDPAFAGRGSQAISFVREYFWQPDEGILRRRFRDGDVGVEGYLADYAYLARGALDLFGVTANVSHLELALSLTRSIERQFYDEEAGTLYFTPHTGEDILVRTQERKDQSTPSSIGVALEVFSRLNGVVPHDRFDAIVEQTLSTHANQIASNPLEHASLALVADARQRGRAELTLAVDGGIADWPVEWRDQLATTYLPAGSLMPRPPKEAGMTAWLDTLDLAAAGPLWANRNAHDGEWTIYACRNYTCSPPTDSMESALDWLSDQSSLLE